GLGLRRLRARSAAPTGRCSHAYCVAATNFHQIHPGGAILQKSYWLQAAKNYARFCALHPTIDVFLHWRFATALLSPLDYNALVKSFEGSESFSPPRSVYLRASRDLAEAYYRCEDPRPVAIRRQFPRIASDPADQHPPVM